MLLAGPDNLDREIPTLFSMKEAESAEELQSTSGNSESSASEDGETVSSSQARNKPTADVVLDSTIEGENTPVAAKGDLPNLDSQVSRKSLFSSVLPDSDDSVSEEIFSPSTPSCECVNCQRVPCLRCHNCRNNLQCFHTWCCSTQDGQVWFPIGCGFPPGWDFCFGKPRTARPKLLPSNLYLRFGKSGRTFSSTEAIPSSVDIDKFYRYVGLDKPQSPKKPESKKKNPQKQSSGGGKLKCDCGGCTRGRACKYPSNSPLVPAKFFPEGWMIQRLDHGHDSKSSRIKLFSPTRAVPYSSAATAKAHHLSALADLDVEAFDEYYGLGSQTTSSRRGSKNIQKEPAKRQKLGSRSKTGSERKLEYGRWVYAKWTNGEFFWGWVSKVHKNNSYEVSSAEKSYSISTSILI